MLMKRQKLISKRFNVIMLLVIMLFAFAVQPMLGISESYAATTAVLEDKWRGNYGNWQFKFKGYNGYGLCAYDSKKSAEVGASGTVTDISDSNIIKIVYYVLFKKNGVDLSNKEMSFSHVYLSYKLNGKKSFTDNSLQYLDGALEWAKQYEVMDLPPDYEQFRVYQWTPGGKDKDKQPVVFFSYVTPGSLTLIKSSADSKALGTGMYHLTGTEYTIFKSDRKTEVGKLIVADESGQTNTIITEPGTYYIRETKTPASSGFKINDTWMTAEVVSGNAVTIRTEGDAAEIPIMSHAYIRKYIKGNDPATSPFEFDLVNTSDNSIRYSLSTGTSGNLKSPEIEILAGTYLVSEHLVEGYESDTQPYEITVNPGETAEIKWTNKMLHKGKIAVIKENLDGLSAEGFEFKLTGVLFRKILDNGNIKYITERILNEDDAIKKAGLNEPSNNNLNLGEWKIDQKSLQSLNDAARNGNTGNYSLIFHNEISAGENHTPIEIQVSVVLKNMVENSGEDVGAPITEAEPETSVLELESGKLSYNSTIEFAGARTEYLDEKTGKNYSEIFIGKENLNERDVPFGRYTVTEQLNDFQHQRYHDENGNTYEYAGSKHTVATSITKDITGDSTAEDFTFSFKNVPRTTRARLHKDAEGSQVAGIIFNLKSIGKTAAGISYDSQFITDEDGNIDFGELYAGTYILEELNFNSDNWVNTYPLDGHIGPAIKFTITGNEKGTIWIGGDLGRGDVSIGENNKPARVFKNKPLTKLYISKIDSDSKVYLPGVKFQIRDETDDIVAEFTLTRNDAGVADIIMTKANEGISGGACIGEKMVDSDNNSDIDSDREYIVIKGLEQGMKYTLVEIEAPNGYLTANDVSFDFNDGMYIDVENSIPEIYTEASGKNTGARISLADENISLIDSVKYSKLIPDREYVLRGTLVYAGEEFKSAEESAVLENGKPVTSEVTFKPDNADGMLDVEFNFDGSNTAGKDIVIFEELLEDGKTVVSHCDPENKMQTVSMPIIETHAELDGSVVKDVVTYENLLSGRRYVCRGWLVDSSTGKKISGSDGFNVFYVNEGKETGNIDVDLKMDMVEMAGKKVTAFEELYLAEEDIDQNTGIPTITEEILVAEHKDISDAEQTVNIPKPTTPKTGDSTYLKVVELLAAMIIAMTGAFLILKNRRA